MSYETDEASVQASNPREIYKIELTSNTYYLTSHAENIQHDGHLYLALPMSRGTTPVVAVGQDRDLTISLPVDDPAVLDYIKAGVPPKHAFVTITRLQPTGTRQIWKSEIVSIDTDGEYARFKAPSIFAQKFSLRLPVISASRMCNHALYDAGCTVDRTAHDQQALVSLVTGTDLTVNWSGSPPAVGWATGGEVVNSSGTERRTVIGQTANHLFIDAPFRNGVFGTNVTVYAGCDLTIETCRDKFANVLNFGGHPHLPAANPQMPTGLGVIVQA